MFLHLQCAFHNDDHPLSATMLIVFVVIDAEDLEGIDVSSQRGQGPSSHSMYPAQHK